MTNVYRVFTIENGTVSEGAKIENLHLKGANIDIAAVLVGEEGRGRHQEAMPIDRPPMVACPDRGKDVYESGDKCKKCAATLGAPEPSKGGWSGETRKHPEQGLVLGTLKFAEIGATKAAKPKFFAKDAPTTDEKVIVVFRTQIGFRGGNSHTGDKFYVPCPKRGQHVSAQYICDDCGERILPKPEDGGTVEESNARTERFYAGAIHPDAGTWRSSTSSPEKKLSLAGSPKATQAAWGAESRLSPSCQKMSFSGPDTPVGCTASRRRTITCGTARN